MSRVQLALNVSDLEKAIGFYSKLFGAEPAKRRPGYANFAIAEPPLKLVLIEGHGEPGTMNHLGVEVESHRRGRRRHAPAWRPRGWSPPPRTRSRVATRCRTRCGSTPPTGSRGRSTPCSATSSTPPASSARSSPARTPCAAGPPPSPLSAAAEPWPACSSLSTSPTWTRRSPSTPSCSAPRRRSTTPATRTSPSPSPPLKLILIEGHGEPGSLNHLGVEVASSEDVVAATARLAAEGMRTSVEEQVACGYSVQDKVWVEAPEGGPWEIYTVLGDKRRRRCRVQRRGVRTSRVRPVLLRTGRPRRRRAWGVIEHVAPFTSTGPPRRT